MIVAHGFGQVFDPGLGTEVADWSTFSATHQDGAVEVWLLLGTGSIPGWSLLGFAGVLAMYISGNYRALLAGLVLGPCLPWCCLRMEVPAAIFLYSLLVLHLGSALALFTLLKFVQEPLLAEAGQAHADPAHRIGPAGRFRALHRGGTPGERRALRRRRHRRHVRPHPQVGRGGAGPGALAFTIALITQRRGPGMRQVSPDPMPRTLPPATSWWRRAMDRTWTWCSRHRQTGP